jgi:hypothetical protein
MTERTASIRLGIVVERRSIAHPWQKERWRPVDVIVGAAEVEGWRPLLAGDGWARWHAATLPLVVHRKETEAYLYNLTSRAPALYVGLRRGDDPAFPWQPFLVTASPWEAFALGEIGGDIVEGVPMPEPVLAWLADFVERHHVDQPFEKRQRRRDDAARDGRHGR